MVSALGPGWVGVVVGLSLRFELRLGLGFRVVLRLWFLLMFVSG